MARSTLCGYDFTDFTSDLELTDRRHPHIVRREPGTTYRDEYALAELNEISPLTYLQICEGWSRSFYSGQQHLEAILQYALQDVPISHINQQCYQDSINVVRIELRSLPTVRALSVLTELDSVHYKPSSAAGYDYIGAKGPQDGENHQRAIRRAKATLWSAVRTPNEGIEHVIRTAVPDVGYTRTQLTDLTEKMKVRSVWGRSFHYILLEGTAAKPLLDAFTSSDTFYHIGGDPLDSVPELLSETAHNCKWLYSIDWQSFDATVSRFEINAAFDLIKEKLFFPDKETEDTFEISRQLFIHKKIAAPDGKIYWAHKGIPSGSYYTSLIGSIINRLRIEYIWRQITGQGPKMCSTQGDDSLSGDDVFIPPERFATVANPIGWYFNPAKTEYSVIPEEVTFLGRTFLGGANARNLERCIRLLIFPEYPVSAGNISAYRAKSIAEDAGNLSELLNLVALRLQRQYGIASTEDVPFYFKLYKPGLTI